MFHGRRNSGPPETGGKPLFAKAQAAKSAAGASAKTKASKKTVKGQGEPGPKEKSADAKPGETGKHEEEEGGWRRFLWNPDTKELLSRSWSSWLLITIFYLIFFACLGAFFIMSWFVSLLVINNVHPNRYGEKSIIWKSGPGLTIRPTPDRIDNGMSTLIWFSTGSYEDHKFWSYQLKDWMENLGEDFKAEDYGPCSGIDDKEFGYGHGEPCILIKLNRIYDWKPKSVKSEDLVEAKLSVKAEDGTEDSIPVPKALRKYAKDKNIDKEGIIVWCEGEYDHDKENLGSIQYWPGPYIEESKFPFTKKRMPYQTPFLMIKLNRPVAGALISVVCQAFAKNIVQSRELKVGYLRFQLLIG